MNIINSITNNPNQTFAMLIPGYANAQITMNFKENQNAWFMALSWGNFTVSNILMSCSYNILRQFKNKIPFGIAIGNTSGTDPLFVESWSQGYNQFYLLDSSDVEGVETTFYG